MTIQYKNAGFALDTTSVKTLFTCPTSGVAIVKSVLIANDHSSDVAVKAAINDVVTGVINYALIDRSQENG